jgi:hypothetical protein
MPKNMKRDPNRPQNTEFSAEMVKDNESQLYYADVTECLTGNAVFKGPRCKTIVSASAAGRARLMKMEQAILGAEYDAVKDGHD